MRLRPRKRFACSTISRSKDVLSPSTRRERRNREAGPLQVGGVVVTGLARAAAVVTGPARQWAAVAAVGHRAPWVVLPDRPRFDLPHPTSSATRAVIVAVPIAPG